MDSGSFQFALVRVGRKVAKVALLLGKLKVRLNAAQAALSGSLFEAPGSAAALPGDIYF